MVWLSYSHPHWCLHDVNLSMMLIISYLNVQVKAPRVNLRPQVEIPKINGRIAGHVEYMIYIAMAQKLQQVNKENTVIFFGELRALKSYIYIHIHIYIWRWMCLSHRWKYYTSSTWIWHFTGCWLAGQNTGMHWIHRHNTLEVSSNSWIPIHRWYPQTLYLPGLVWYVQLCTW